MNGNTNLVRKEQTEVEFFRLKSESSAWWSERYAGDSLKQYRTQLNAIKSLLDSAIDYLQAQLNALDLNVPPGDIYESCRLFDLRVIWLRKVWQFYKEKFDQRADKTLQPILMAADEVVWSCYRQVVDQAKLYVPEFKQGPAPLPFIETSFSPESFPSELVPYDLKPSETGFLQDLINQLPIPLVSLPQSCVKAPWWLVYIGHEIGHHVQYALLDKRRFIKLFQTQVEDVVNRNGGIENDSAKWGRWSKEIFADVFSVLMMGPWAVWSMVEFEMKKASEMLDRRDQYPSPVARLSLLATTADQLGLDGTAALRGINLAQMAAASAQATRDLALVPHVVKSTLAQLPLNAENGVTLERLTAFRAADYLPKGDVPGWTQALRGPQPLVSASTSLRAPRLIASATLAAWAEITTVDKMARENLRRNLADAAVNLIVLSREDISRSSALKADEEVIEAIPGLGRELGKKLFQADPQQLEL